jgi:hypothetical protein
MPNNNNNLPPTPPLTPPSTPPLSSQPLPNFPNINRSIPNAAEIVFTSTPIRNNQPRRIPTLKRKIPFGKKLENALGRASLNEAMRNRAITPKRGKKISFAPNTKNVDPTNDNTQPLGGGRRRSRRKSRRSKRKSYRR